MKDMGKPKGAIYIYLYVQGQLLMAVTLNLFIYLIMVMTFIGILTEVTVQSSYIYLEASTQLTD